MNVTMGLILPFFKPNLGILFLLSCIACSVAACDKWESQVPDWVVYPETDWVRITPAQAGFDELKFNKIISSSQVRGANFAGEVHDNNRWGAVLTRGGYLVHTWGDPDFRYQSASLGKAFTRAVLGLAVDEGLVSPDDLINRTWTGEGQLSHLHKYLDWGFHKSLTWRHLLKHRGGFPVTNGYYWRKGLETKISPFPKWAKPTGDPFYDNYAHSRPGTRKSYSSGGYWRLAQALTSLWHNDIKEVLDEKLLSHIGIPADRWDWTPGRFVHNTRDWYPDMPGYGDFIDPPYEINGHVVRGGPGWVVMSPKDLARFGLLIATGGIWKGRRLISSEWIRGHAGGNGGMVLGDRKTYISIGIVTAKGVPHRSLRKTIIDPAVVSPSP